MFDKVPIGRIEGPGRRAYLAVAGGLSAPQVLGSRATFALGRFGGHATVTLTTGDVLHLAHAPAGDPAPPEPAPLTHDWQVGVLCGPHGAPDFFMDSDIAIFFGADYEVHCSSARTGVRPVGPAPRWRAQTGARLGCTRRTCMTTPVRSAPSTSPATCR